MFLSRERARAKRSQRLRLGLVALGILGASACSASPREMAGATAMPSPAGAMGPMANAEQGDRLDMGEGNWHRPMRAQMEPVAKAPEPPPPPAPAGVAAEKADEDFREAPKQPPAPPPPQWAPVREFPIPVYQEGYDGPREDFRETVFWAPSIQTNDRGEGQVDFVLSDAITSFRAVAEGVSASGGIGRGEALIASKLPVSIAAKLPLELSTGDVLDLPVTLTNATRTSHWSAIQASFGSAFEVVTKDLPARIELNGRASTTQYYGLKVKPGPYAPDAGTASIAVNAAGLSDAVKRVIRVVPSGFPREEALSGTLSGTIHETIDIGEPTTGSLEVSMNLYPSPTATLVAGTEAMIAEPGGCFEQASSNNYPNVMVMSYLGAQEQQDAALLQKTQGMLDRGYKRLAGYESKSHGYEWFGEDPGHEALTAYGLMEFNDMAKVYKDVDHAMIQRTEEWLRSKRDGNGGYKRNSRALDSFGAASEDVTNAYITYALSESGAKDIEKEIEHVRKMAGKTKDPYVLALAANALENADPKSSETANAVRKLATLQGKGGNYPGASQSITRSGGEALEIETTALATLALMKAVEDFSGPIQKGLDYIVKQRNGNGGFGSTQSTVLALKVLTKAAARSRVVPEGTISLVINGKAHQVKLDPSMRETITLAGLAGDLKTGKNSIDITASSASLKMPYSIRIGYRTLKPASSSKAAVKVEVQSPKQVRNGDAVKVSATVSNVTASGIPMVIARIGIPGGTTYQTWQLKELVEKKIIDAYETREREVIVYFRAMGPKAKKQFDLDLLATVPGTFTAPASQTYLYYTDELRNYAEPIQLTVTR